MLSSKSLALLFDLESKRKAIAANEECMANSEFWNEPKKAQHLIKETNELKKVLDMHQTLSLKIDDLISTVDELNKDYDEDLKAILEEEYIDTLSLFQEFEIHVLLSADHDHSNAIVELHPGAGGTESQDWAMMLLGMYRKWADSKGFKVTILDYQDGDEAGIKSASILIEGPLAYGYLKGEKGVHRLVRISPFDLSGRRHTSFASVDVMPEFNDEIEIVIEEKDIEIDTHRASGAGGQHVNKTDSAVRIVHKPTGLVASCQTERSQLQNKERALTMLKSKLYQKELDAQLAKVNALKGEQKLIEWGSQIRSYVFCPYTMVKDHRTGYDETAVEQVMNGAIDNLIFSYLKAQVGS